MYPSLYCSFALVDYGQDGIKWEVPKHMDDLLFLYLHSQSSNFLYKLPQEPKMTITWICIYKMKPIL